MQIDQQFKELIPALSDDERKGLEENILQNGCRDPLVLWQGVLIDGHNRHEICTKHGIEYKTVSVDLPDRDAVIDWIERNQLGRRNLTPDWFKYLLGRLYNRTKKAQGFQDAGPGRGKTLDQNDPVFSSTAAKLAKEHAVSEPTVKRAAKFAEEVDATPELKEALVSRQPVSKVKKQAQIQHAKETIQQQTREDTQGNPPTAYHESASAFLKRLPPQSVNLLLTDPPYSTDVPDVAAFAQAWLPRYLETIRPDGSAYVFIGAYPEELKAYLNIETPDHIGIAQVLVWTYRNTLGQNPKSRYKLNWQAVLYYRGVDAGQLDCPSTAEQWAVQDVSAPDGRQGDRYHEWQKPAELFERFIRHSTSPGDTVIDPFVCTGTSIIAASRLGRIGMGCDIDADSLEIARGLGCTIIGQ
jgi:hypothetical protein